MSDIRTEELAYPESTLKRQLRHEIDLGIALAADPANANLPEVAIRITTVHSPWYARTCKVCKHKFREGDQVRLCPQCDQPYHDDDQYDLHCWQEHFSPGEICSEGGVDRFSEEERETPRCDYTWSGLLPDGPTADRPADEAKRPHVSPAELLVTQFVTGVEKVWQPFAHQKVEKVQLGSSIIGHKQERVAEAKAAIALPRQYCEIGTGGKGTWNKTATPSPIAPLRHVR